MPIENETQETLAQQMENGENEAGQNGTRIPGPKSFLGARPFAKTIKGARGGRGDKKGSFVFLLIGSVVVLGLGFFLVSNMPGKGKPQLGSGTKTDTNTAKPSALQGSKTPALPNEQTAGASQQQQTGGLTPDALQATSRLAPNDDAGGAGAGDGKASNRRYGDNSYSQTGSQAANLGDIPQLQPPPVPGANGQNGQWTPPPYQGGAVPVQTWQQIAETRRAAVVKSSLTVYTTKPEAQESQGSLTNASGIKEGESSEPITNFGYEPGYHIAAHLESVATTAISAPVIAVVDYDYRRGGVPIIPAGSRVIGTMGASSGSIGIVTLRFSSIRLHNGMTVPISAIGLNPELGPLKGIVTGRNRIKQILLAAAGGIGSTAAVFAGNSNINGQLNEADLMRQQAAQNIGGAVDSQVQQLQATQNIIVTLPAGTPLQVSFTTSSKTAPTN